MVALPELPLVDDLDDLAELLALMGPPGEAGLLDRLEEARPAWTRRAACRGAGVDFYDPAQVDRAVALCATCAVVDECQQASRRERFGVWGGKVPAGLRLVKTPVAPRGEKTPRPKGRAIVTCAECGEVRTLQGKGLCAKCHSAAARRAAGAKQRRYGPTVGICLDCQAEGPLKAKGRCRGCYGRRRRRAARVSPQSVLNQSSERRETTKKDKRG
jgi:hypothetical protein